MDWVHRRAATWQRALWIDTIATKINFRFHHCFWIWPATKALGTWVLPPWQPRFARSLRVQETDSTTTRGKRKRGKREEKVVPNSNLQHYYQKKKRTKPSPTKTATRRTVLLPVSNPDHQKNHRERFSNAWIYLVVASEMPEPRPWRLPSQTIRFASNTWT